MSEDHKTGLSENDCFILDAAEQHGVSVDMDGDHVTCCTATFVEFIKVAREQGRQDAHAVSAGTLSIPETLTDDLREILGKPCFHFIRLSALFRAAGHDIKKRAKDEQAFFLHWLLRLHVQHGPAWADAANAEARRIAEGLKTAPTAAAEQRP